MPQSELKRIYKKSERDLAKKDLRRAESYLATNKDGDHSESVQALSAQLDEFQELALGLAEVFPESAPAIVGLVKPLLAGVLPGFVTMAVRCYVNAGQPNGPEMSDMYDWLREQRRMVREKQLGQELFQEMFGPWATSSPPAE